ncbi:Protein of uncharacterised function [Mycobacteroides abscessus subsp. abscessus]|nr:Protein of uncharacterised function [Mycobacteroides abscessus subsp. abscessus]SLE51830.1 Protein of uncharacterised function [Mycobacteroides abscessus subsp. abscessus]
MGDADHIVLWHGQDNAHDSAFYHAMCAKVPEVPLNVVTLRQATASYAPTELAQHMKDSRAVTSDMRTAARRVWKQMEQDNQTFRVLSDGKLISAASDYYDTALLGAIGQDWTPIVQAVAPVMANMDIGDSPLFWRIKLLIESGKLMADGNPWLVHRSKVKRTDSSAC